MTLQQLLLLSIVKPEVLPDNVNLRKNGILNEKVWGPAPSDKKDKVEENKEIISGSR